MPEPLDVANALPWHDVALVAWLRWRSLMVAFTVPVILSLAALDVLPPRYGAIASVMVKTGREYLARDEGQVSGQSAPQTSKQEAVNSEIEIMASRVCLDQVIARIGIANLYPSLQATTMSDNARRDAAVARLSRTLRVTAVKISNVLDVSFQHRDPAMAERVLRELLAIYKARHLAVFSGDGSSRAYGTAIARDFATLGLLQRERARIEREDRVYDASAQRLSLIGRRADEEDRRRRAIDERQSLRDRMASLRAAGLAIPASEIVTETDRSDNAAAPATSLVELERARSDLLARFAPDHPRVQAIEAQIDAVRREASAARPFIHIRTERSDLARSVADELVMDAAKLAPLDGQIARAEAAIGGFDRELERIGTADASLRLLASRIEGVEDNLREERSQFAKAEALDGMDALDAVSVSVIEPPAASLMPVFPRPFAFEAGGLVLGLLAALGTLASLVLFDDRVLTEDGLARASGLPLAGAFPYARL
jgi:uncharacterized protein involved in exopolysaccharide biosynthesis